MPILILVLVWLCNITYAFSAGPQTHQYSAKDFDKVYYVSLKKGNNVPGAGTRSNPWKTLDYALQTIVQTTKNQKVAIWVAQGVYEVNNLMLPDHFVLLGGFSENFQTRDILRFSTILDGKNENRIMIVGNHTLIDGFIFQHGLIRGKGGAIFIRNVSITISNNVFKENSTLIPQPWKPKYRHEIANDGGAIYCEAGANVIIRQNLFINNTTETGRGAAIALHDYCGGVIQGNVFIQNTAGLKDPKRSSDGGAVSVFKWSNPKIENNIFLNNRTENRNDGGAIFVALWSSPVIQNNILVGNYGDDDGGALFVGGQEHRYDRPPDKMPPADKFLVKILKNTFIGNANASRNSGAMRLTMETRGKFEGNVCALNTGIYFQRSEMTIRCNVIMDDFLCIETRQWLKPYEIFENIILGKFTLIAPANVKGNWIRDQQRENSSNASLNFVQDRQVLPVWSVNFDPKIYQTTVFLGKKRLQPEVLKNRVVHLGEHWGVVANNDEQFVRIWGKLQGAGDLIILPTYQLAN